MANVTFLAAGRPLAKHFSPEKVTSYPNMKNFTSIEAEVNNLEELHTLLLKHAEHGNALFKGTLLRKLNNEPRRGLTDKLRKTELMVLDIDGIELQNYRKGIFQSKEEIIRIADEVVRDLPNHFHDVSYIVQPSSSFGVKENKASLHFFFLLDKPVDPAILKTYLTGVNFVNSTFSNQLRLTAAGNSLSYVCDPSIADNSRIIYIGNPTFVDMPDPIPEKSHRFLLQTKGQPTFKSAAIESISEKGIKSQVTQKINRLRDACGLPDNNFKSQVIQVNGQTTEVIINPDKIRMEFYSDNGNFVSYDVNGGDSHAYYVKKFEPAIVYNFKGEPNFLFEQADPETYKWHIETFISTKEVQEDVEAKKMQAPVKPFVFRDLASDQFHNGLINLATNSVELMYPVSKTGVKGMTDFMAQYGEPMPVNVPICNYIFDPTDPRGVDLEHGFINRYTEPDILGEARQLTRTIDLVKDCPTIYGLLWSAVGADRPTADRFLNWLAYIVQTKQKTGIAWIFQGVQGTGKGQLFSRVLSPLIGSKYCAMKTLESLEEQFNSFLQENILLCVDEFRLQDSRSYDKLMNKIKNIITEKQLNLRKMHANAVEMPSYTNVIFFSNVYDVIRIEETDRRFSICPRQEKSLKESSPELLKKLDTEIEKELPLFAKAILDYQVNESLAKTPLENGAKDSMKELSVTSIQQITNAFRFGELEFFVEHLMDKDLHSNAFMLPAQNLMRAIIRDYDPNSAYKLTGTDAHTLYCAITNSRENQVKFTRTMRLHGLDNTILNIAGIAKRGYLLKWQLENTSIEALRNVYCGDIKQFVPGEKSLHVVQAEEIKK